MEILFVVVVVIAVLIIKNRKAPIKSVEPTKSIDEEMTTPELPIVGAYQKRWMFTFNEKDAYSKLLPIAQEQGYIVFAKVRVLDLIEPIKGSPKYKTYFYKIQAKHVDFVLCDKKLVARYIIELDDSSHETEHRKQRDAFLDQALSSAGYKIIHVKAITEELKAQLQ